MTFVVWECFVRENVQGPYGTAKSMAPRKFCKALYSGSRSGTGHLKRYMDKYMLKQGHVDTTTQTQLQWNPDGSVTTWS